MNVLSPQEQRHKPEVPSAIQTAQAAGAHSPADIVQVLLSVFFIGLVIILLVGGALFLAISSPQGAAGLSSALLGPHSYWYLSRASAFVSYGLLWWSMALGLAITNRMARAWPGGPTVAELHEHASLLGLAFGLLHALALLGDRYIGYTLPQLLIPFASTAYRPVWVGLGQVSLYLLVPVTFSFYVRRWIDARVWRAIHALSFLLFALALAHGVWSGTDTSTPWAFWIYLVSSVTLFGLTVQRFAMHPSGPKRQVS